MLSRGQLHYDYIYGAAQLLHQQVASPDSTSVTSLSKSCAYQSEGYVVLNNHRVPHSSATLQHAPCGTRMLHASPGRLRNGH